MRMGIMLLAAAFGCSAPAGLPLDDSEFQEIVDVLAGMANESQESMAYAYSCPSGGEAEVVATFDEEQEPGIVRISGRWEVETDDCGTSPIPDVTIHNSRFVFSSEVVWNGEAETRHIEAHMEATFDWSRTDTPRLYPCDEGNNLSRAFEAGFGEPFDGSIEGQLCGQNVAISVQSFPGGNWSF
ncbi:MAG: hypothetical protein OXG18_00560 [Gemmatimonadetes bacterium]|nr:hypothetical protein [Gemmatimonadota bacterium]